jgi:HK97 family phage prohead protease
MTENLIRAFAGEAVRADRTGRTIAGIIVPFDTPARVSDGGAPYMESFQYGSFTKTIAENPQRVKLLYQHNSLEPIGRAVELREERGVGLYGEFQVSSVARGDQALELVNDGVIDSFSVGFSGIKAEKRGGVTVRTEVKLREASLVTFPAYDTARITAIRAALSDVGELPDDAIEALVRAFDLRDLTQIPATTDDGQPEQIVSPVDEPASATRDVSAIHRSLRLKAREIGLI